MKQFEPVNADSAASAGNAMEQEQHFYPLTHPQQRVWYTEKLHPGTSMWNNAGTLKIRGVLDFALLEKAVIAYIRDNPSLRLRVTEREGVPCQYISRYVPCKLDFLDFSAKGLTGLYEWDSVQTQAPMPIMDACLYYFAVIRLSDSEGGVFAKVHHLISDALSLMNLSNQIMENYRLLLEGKDLPPAPDALTYLDYIRAEQEYLHSRRFEYDRQYWNERFRDVPAPAVFKETPPGETGTRARRKSFVLSARTSAAIREFCKARELSVFSLFLAALGIYIERITGKNDVVLSGLVYNRTTPGMLDVFGMFISTVPIRLGVDDETSFWDYAQNVSSEWFSVLKHQKYPYELLLQDLRRTNKGLNTLYDITLSYQNGKFERDNEFFSLEGRWHFSGHQTNSVSIHISDREDQGKFIVDYDYLTPLYSARELEYIHTHLMNLIGDAIVHPEKKLCALDILSEEERTRVLYSFNDTFRPYPAGETMLDLWNRQAALTPDALAVLCGGAALTYRELDQRSTDMAAELEKHGLRRDEVVALLCTRSIACVVSAMAVVKTGAAYLPIEAGLPEERIRYMLRDCGARVVIASAKLLAKCPQDLGLAIVPAEGPFERQPSARRESRNSPEDLAYVIYTSGSTGQPKGVMLEHRSLVNYIYAMGELWDFSQPDCRLLCAASISFDISVMEIWSALAHGAMLVMATDHELNIPRNMANLLLETRTNMACLTPGRMELLLTDTLGAESLKQFRELGMGGDVVTERLLRKVQSCTRARLYDMYGPTEITIAATAKELSGNMVPNIGHPLPNTRVYILDKHRNPVPIGIHGELYIGGRGVARGYIHKPELDAERFLENPFVPGDRLYRTGDLARWFPLGDIEYLGRIDQQVKIRGYRVELGEIEERLLRLDGISDCAVVAHSDAGGKKFLCAYVCGENVPSRSDMKAALIRELPVYMIPSFFVTLAALPLSTSGKVDRRSLPDPTALAEFSGTGAYEPPETDSEQLLSAIWTACLGVSRISRDDNFLDIGGDSLSIVEVMAQVQRQMHVDISLEEVYRCPTLRAWAELIDRAQVLNYQPMIRVEDRRSYPVSAAQRQMYVVAQSAPESLAYNIPAVFELRGEVDAAALENAIRRLIERHEALRTGFVMRGGSLCQVIHRRAAFRLQRTVTTRGHLTETLRGLVRPFALDRPPLLRAALIGCGPRRQVLLVDLHHIVSDRQSMLVLLEELEELYGGLLLPKKQLDYRDFAVWQQNYLKSDAIRAQRAYWLKTLEGELPLLNLHTDRPRGAGHRFEGARLDMEVPAALTAQLRTFAQARHVTLYMLTLAVYNVLLSKYTGQEDIIVGTPSSGRQRAELGRMVGVFVNMLPMRCFPRGELTFAEFLDEVRRSCLGAYENAEYPFDALVRDLKIERSASRNPLFDTLLAFQNGPEKSLSLRGAEVTRYPYDPGSAKMDLSLEISEGRDSLSLSLEYCTALYHKASMQRLMDHFLRLLELLTARPQTRLRDASPLSPEELRRVTLDFNRTEGDVDLRLPVQAIFERTAREYAQKPALLFQGERMTFAELNARANRIARRLRAEGVGPNSIVVLSIRRSFELLAGLLGILKAGGAYLPVDPDYPQERISFMMKDSGAALLLTDGLGPMPFEGRVILTSSIGPGGDEENLSPLETAEDACYVIYTSGSTGIPKGVILSRKNMVNLWEGTRDIVRYDPAETSVCATTVSFDIFVIDCLMPLFFGCTVALSSEEELRQPALLARVVEETDAKFLQTTPTRMHILMSDRTFRAAAQRHLNKVMCGGEEFPLSLLKLLRRCLPKARIISGYGPTETTVYCTFKELTHTNTITIGKPMVNTRMYILDRYENPAPIGVLGEAYISGACVGTEYIGRDELNREKFRPDPFHPGEIMYRSGDICAWREDGEMDIRGRVDHQVKIRGLRIELGEIEAGIREFPGVTEAVVMALSTGEDRYLCAYFESPQGTDESQLRAHLARKLPSYMVPPYFVQLKKLPLTPNGKIDRRALPKHERTMERARRVFAAPQTATQKKMARVWSRILGVREVGPDDDFFELGGDSLAVIRVQSAILQNGWTLRTQDFYELRTLGRICDRLDGPRGLQSGAERNAREYAAMEPWLGVGTDLDAALPLPPARLDSVLLTGVTGFLGAHLLEELVRAYDAKVFCLVRGRNAAESKERLQDVLRFYFGGQAGDLMRNVVVVNGDAARPNLGMTRAAAAQAGTAHTLLHAAASTSHVGQAEDFEAANVTATRNAAEFARTHRMTLLHISTVSVGGTCFVRDPERTGPFAENDFYIGQDFTDNIYVRTKFEAEAAVLGAAREGLDARIFRVGNLCARQRDGQFQINPAKNAFANRIRAIARLGCIAESMLESEAELTPVDLCAAAVLLLAGHPEAHRVCHVCSPHRVRAARLAELMGACGIPVTVVPDRTFAATLRELSKRGEYEGLNGLVQDLGEKPARIRTECAETVQALERLGFAWPEPDREYFRRYLAGIEGRNEICT